MVSRQFGAKLIQCSSEGPGFNTRVQFVDSNMSNFSTVCYLDEMFNFWGPLYHCMCWASIPRLFVCHVLNFTLM